MTKSKNTKKALLLSVLSVLVCIAMLVGSTFAWFTDSVTSGKNVIKSGNLDIDLKYKDVSGQYVQVKPETSLFNSNALWEPGHVEFVNLKVENLGTLALKYKLDVNVIEHGSGGYTNVNGQKVKVSDFVYYSVINGEKNYTLDDAGRKAAISDAETAGSEKISAITNYMNGTLMPKDMADSEQMVTIVLYMPETVGNEANAKLATASNNIYTEFGVTLLAAQTPYEKDSFNDQYDKNAQFAVSTNTPSEVSSILSQGKDAVIESDMAVTGPIKLYKDVSASVNLGNKTITAVEDTKGDGVFNAVSGTLTIKGEGTVNSASTKNDYSMAVWAGAKGTINIESGNFTNVGAGSDTHYDLIYASEKSVINISGGTYKAHTPKWTLNCKDHDANHTATIVVTGGTFYKFDPVKVAAAVSSADDTGVDGQWYVGKGEIIVPEGYTSVKNGDWYTIVKK